MDSVKIRKLFLDFFKKKGHTIMPSSSLLPTDTTVLFTTAGMQQFKPYYLEEKSPYGENIVSCQKCFRTSDIDEVGDENHLTFFEMLGNFSFGGYFKKEAIKMAHEFITEVLGLEIDYVSIFFPDKIKEGDWRKIVQKDGDSYNIWKDEIGLPTDKIKMEGVDNFWGPTGNEGPCGPTTEIYVKNLKGKSIEIWNLVFNEYFCDSEKKLKKLEKFGVDTGMGLERLAIVTQKVPSVFETDLFASIIEKIRNNEKVIFSEVQKIKSERIIADHIKSSVFLASEGIFPSNIEQGYVLRKLLRRAIRYGKIIKLPSDFLILLAKEVIEIYKNIYPELKTKETDILTIIQKEKEKFEGALEKGLKEFDKLIKKDKKITGETAFNLYETYGFPLELTEELVAEKGLALNREEFKKAFEKHKDISRTGAEKKFGGVGKEADYKAVKLHTATHLLHQALRDVLGIHIQQMGSDITSQRLRFDFSHPFKIASVKLNKVEEIVNQKIKEDLQIKKEIMEIKKALSSGALAFFKEKYPPEVSVYSILDSSGRVFSKEICAGPHVNRTSELGKFKIIKEESSSSGVRRIRAILE